MPINFFWSLTFPFRPSSKSNPPASFLDLLSAPFALYGAIKSLEWGFSRESYYTRPLQVIDGIKKWQKASDDLHKKAQEESCSFFQLITWTLLQLSSARGLQFTWGPAMAANTQSTYSLLWRVFRVNIPLTCVSAFIVFSRDSHAGTPESALLSLGFPKFPGLALLSETIYTACFGIWAACSLDIRYTLITLGVTLIHKLATLFKCRQEILELFDPIYYPPMFNSPHKSPSLSHLWGRGWHTALQRIFLVAGGKPMIWITKKIGASTKTQRLAGLLGTFAASGAVHEYISFVWTQGREMSHSHSAFFVLSSMFYFTIQAFGMILEPYLVPLIPKKLGGGRLWMWAFGLLTAYPFRKQYMNASQIHTFFLPLSEWSWLYILSPLKD
ncbi:hypothetical protein CROQUDRAFT_49585 [Cronartium quercuum f. sp. fusiforme G11]|uniref:Wax synthase domain-containing protein n=1 Tax=Cronartium quercuum f. sp. fusiforme G11 TaxID=708437 RepID=A0A9P6NF63_9BASI|nr:hypothetical protein CROQUDRAFT_49585 [Cronartium quercuum f. sp. fusiforme G11]